MKNDVISPLKEIIEILKNYNDSIEGVTERTLEIISNLADNISILNHLIDRIDSSYDALDSLHKERFEIYSKPVIERLIINLNEIVKKKDDLEVLNSLEKFQDSISKIENSFYNLESMSDAISKYQEKENKTKELVSELEQQVEIATNSVKSVISAKEALESKPTENIYSNAAKKYIKTARFYDVLLLILLGIFYYLTTQFFQNFQMIAIFKAIKKLSSEAQTLAIFFFITKLTIVSIVITLATIFIRRSSHFRKLHDQANQTSLELNALPFYLRQVDSELHSEIYKEMIPKFFGKELDQSQNDKVGDLVKDQLAAGTELIKASAEMVKNVKSLGDSPGRNKNIKTGMNSTESSENKDKPKTE